MKIHLLALMLTLAAPALAQQSTPQPVQQPKPDQPKQICRIERDTASRTRTQRICHTQEEWNRLASDASQTIDNMVRSASHDQSAMMSTSGRMPR